MAKVLVSEATRRNAHNLDDLFERWRLRREALMDDSSQEKPFELAIEEFLPPFELISKDQAQSIRQNIVAKKTYLSERLSRIKQERHQKGLRSSRSKKPIEQGIREIEYMLAAAYTYAEKQMIDVNAYLKDKGVIPLSSLDPKTKKRVSRRPWYIFIAMDKHESETDFAERLTLEISLFLEEHQDQNCSLGQWEIWKGGVLVQFWINPILSKPAS